MKNASSYEKKIKKLLGGMGGAAAEAAPPADPIRVLVESVLQADASDKQAEAALAEIEKEYVDFNELRVSPVKEIVECIGRTHPFARRKAESLRSALQAVFQRTCALTLDFLAKKPKKEARRLLLESGLDSYAAARVTLLVFGGHAVPVDETLVDCLKLEGYVHPASDVSDVQGFLERVVPQKNAVAAHRLLRQFVAASAKALARKRKADEAARRRAEQEAQRQAERAEREKAAAAAAGAAPARKRRPRRARAKRPARKAVPAARKRPTRAASKRPRAARKTPRRKGGRK